MNNVQLANLRNLLQRSLLGEEALADKQPWGEDGVRDAFKQGQKYGAHDLAEQVLEVLESTK